MKQFYRWVVNHPKQIFAVFALLFLLGAVCKPFIKVNYDLKDYLPDESPSTVALETMEEEFGGGIPNARAMVRNVSVADALAVKENLLSLDGVTDVTWLDDAVDVTQPLEFSDPDTVETYYQDQIALYSITIDEEKRIEACDAIREVIGEDGCLSGNAVSTAVATTASLSEIPLIATCGVAFALFVLILTTTSWAEPFIVLLGLGVAVLINDGSNLLFGEISFVTNTAGSILQLAVSLDYSVFLLHRFEEFRKTIPSPKEAMVEALKASTVSILSSGLTTVIGFLALCLMKFKIGPDLGIALAKGIAISLITVFVFMPVFILATYRLIDKTRHRSLIPSFHKFGRVVSRLMIPFFCLFFLIAIPAYLGSGSNDFYYGQSHVFGTDTKLGRDMQEIEEVFGKSDTYVLLVPNRSVATEKELADTLSDLPEVSSILSYAGSVGQTIPEQYLDKTTLSKLHSEHYARLVITVNAADEGEETFALVENIREIAESKYPGEWLMAGEGVSALDLRDTVKTDMTKVNLLAIAAVFLVLLLTMKSLTLPILLVLGIESAIWVNLSIPYFSDSPVFFIVYLIISSVQLGATVDYAILFTDRYLEYRTTMDKTTAVRTVISDCTVSVLTSASVLCIVGFLIGWISTHGVLAQFGLILGRGTLCSLAVVLFALPGMLWLFDAPIGATTKGTHFLKKGKQQ